MKEKNRKLMVLVSVLLVTIGVSFAFFVVRTFISGTGGRVVATTASINGATMKVEGTLEFGDENIYPGHSSMSGIKVTATGENVLIPYNVVWNGTNSISKLNYTVYKSKTNVEITTECEKTMKVVDGAQVLAEFCEFTNLDQLGDSISSGTINKSDTKAELLKDEFITATKTGEVVYYYVILEFPNLDEIQNADLGGSFEGKVTVEASDKEADINIVAIKVEQEDGSYKETQNIPESGYELSTSSTCSNSVTPGYDTENKRFYADNLTTSGTSCTLIFDKLPTSEDTIAKLNVQNIKTGTPDFTQTATKAETEENNGVFVTTDGMYNGYSYYWRGAALTNHMIFDNKCWRIVRINGDGSIRLIYNGVPDGTACSGNGKNTSSMVLAGTKYNSGVYNNSYVGWTYNLDYQRPSSNVPQIDGEPATIKTVLEEWYKDNILDKSKVAVGKFCNDRNTKNNEPWRATGENQNYAAYTRLLDGTKTPTFDCPNGDIYHVSVGIITADEAQFAGAVGSTYGNIYYYLYNGQHYWTMTPSYWGSNNARVFYVDSNGLLTESFVSGTSFGARPVINLRSDISINEGSDGTQNNPYIVAD